MIEFIDAKGRKVTLDELSFYSGKPPIEIRRVLKNKEGISMSLSDALDMEETLERNGYYFPCELFISEKTKEALRKYVQKLTDGLFDIRELNISNGKMNNYNKLKEKDNLFYEEIKHKIMNKLNISDFAFKFQRI